MFDKIRVIEGLAETADAKEDKRNANRYGQYKIGEKALYYPDGTYIPKNVIEKVEITEETVPTKGCCGMVLTSPAVSFYVGEKKYRILADSEKQAHKMKAALDWSRV